MKKYFFAVAAIAAIGFTSCKKDYTCTCTYTAGSSSYTKTYNLNDQTRTDAKDACEGYEDNTNGGVLITSCRL